jgi:hypothetical protein
VPLGHASIVKGALASEIQLTGPFRRCPEWKKVRRP